jgi:nickel superoxide dismutase
MKKLIVITAVLVLALFSTPAVRSHCEVPCGIYNDELRFTMIEEHITTIEKAINQIRDLSSQNTQNFNQIVRWVVNKEKHADEIQHIISQYFLTQRLKLTDKGNSEAQKKLLAQLSLCHEILVYAMKAKQTTDLEHIHQLRNAVKNFKVSYFRNMKSG